MNLPRAFAMLAQPFLDEGVLRQSDVFAIALAALRFGEDDPERMLGLALAVRAPRVGHAGVDLERVSRQVDDERRHGRQKTRARPGDEASDTRSHDALPWPSDARAWASRTLSSPMVGEPNERGTPFTRQSVFGRDLLLTRRMYREQERLAEALVSRATSPLAPSAHVPGLDDAIARLFPQGEQEDAARAVRLAAEKHLSIILGGPGTGKTFSVSRLLAALIMNDTLPARGEDLARMSIALAAPTGKAAARMREALREATSSEAQPALHVDSPIRARLQNLRAETLHRLLGIRPDGSCRHDRTNPLAADLIVVDEVSMVDLVLMRQLLEAVRPEARLVLLGDRDQLASVEAGCVLADISEESYENADSPLASCVVRFQTSRRFAASPDIGLVAACIQSYAPNHPDLPAETQDKNARLTLACRVLAGEAHASTEFARGFSEHEQAPARITRLGEPERSSGSPARPTEAQLDALVRPYLEGFDLLRPTGPEPVAGYASLLRAHRVGRRRFGSTLLEPSVQRAILDAFERYRVLAVHRRGPLGVEALERALAARVHAFLYGSTEEPARHWIGRPILITENAYDVRLMNGDVGIILPTPEGPAAVFPSDDDRGTVTVATSRLPPHEGALAMTVHKSQGSQFERVALVLAGRPSPIQTRELVYTGVTRAKNQLTWLGSPTELDEALSTPVERASGLTPLLRQQERAFSAKLDKF
jgi:exodeoxyribonuclease V alpha subunit